MNATTHAVLAAGERRENHRTCALGVFFENVEFHSKWVKNPAFVSESIIIVSFFFNP